MMYRLLVEEVSFVVPTLSPQSPLVCSEAVVYT